MWGRVEQDLPIDVNSSAYIFRIQDMNEAVRMVIGLFYDLLSTHYRKSYLPNVPTSGAYGVSGMSWVAATKRLTATMNRVFATSDEGSLISFRIGTSIYIATVLTRISDTVVVLDGTLPAADNTVDSVLLGATGPVSDSVNLASLDMMRTGQQITVAVSSSLTTATSAVRTKAATIEQLKNFRSSALENKNTIVFALVGSTLNLAKGASLSSYGTLTVFYPGMPVNITADTDSLDIPDGPAYELAVLQLEKVIRGRLGIKQPDLTKEIEGHIRSLYNTFQGEISAEVLKEKLTKLK